jgi:hypothetical protein
MARRLCFLSFSRQVDGGKGTASSSCLNDIAKLRDRSVSICVNLLSSRLEIGPRQVAIIVGYIVGRGNIKGETVRIMLLRVSFYGRYDILREYPE